MPDHGPIIVPLDGSDLAEAALPPAVALAKAWQSRIALVSVWGREDTSLAEALPAVALDIETNAREQIGAYLRKLEARLVDTIPVQAQIREGHAAEQIEQAASELGATAIAIATHGRSGIGRWLYGSTASHVLRHATVPVLAVGPRVLEKQAQEATFRHIMVALDGSAHSESVLPNAASLASATGARISLVRAVPWAVQAYPYTLPDAYVPQVDDELQLSAKAYLQRKESEVSGVEVRAFVVRGAVADGLIDFAEKEAVDLVVMSTHARTGLARAALGSTSDRMLQGPAPVLLMHPDS